MAKACLEFPANAELASTLSRNGCAYAEALTWEQVQPLWINLQLDLWYTLPAPNRRWQSKSSMHARERSPKSGNQAKR